MSLATRCSACGTVFRVVHDQLKVSEGWVRCGRCEQVFNALDSLFDLDRETPPPWPSPGPGATPAPASSATPAQPEPSAAAATQAPAAVEPTAAPGDETPRTPVASETPQTPEDTAGLETQPLLRGQSLDPPSEPPSDEGGESSPDFADARFPSELPDSTPPPLDAPESPTQSAPASPTFVRDAEREARWRRPAVRGGLAVSALMLLAVLLAQVALHQRDALAAHWPPSRPWLEAACEVAGCRIEPLRRIGQLAVDASGLAHVDDRTYRLNVVLRNHGATALLLPAVELSLTDTQGQLVARKVLTPAELGATTATLDAGAELPLQALLAAGERRIAGYTIELFYP